MVFFRPPNPFLATYIANEHYSYTFLAIHPDNDSFHEFCIKVWRFLVYWLQRYQRLQFDVLWPTFSKHRHWSAASYLVLPQMFILWSLLSLFEVPAPIITVLTLVMLRLSIDGLICNLANYIFITSKHPISVLTDPILMIFIPTLPGDPQDIRYQNNRKFAFLIICKFTN